MILFRHHRRKMEPVLCYTYVDPIPGINMFMENVVCWWEIFGKDVIKVVFLVFLTMVVT